MRILHINKYYFLKGGAEKSMIQLMGLQQARGHDVAVFAMEHPKNLPSKWSKYFVSWVETDFRKDSRQQGVGSVYQKLRTAARMFYSFEARKKLSKLLDDFQPDVVHVHNYHHQLSASILQELKSRGLPVVQTLHDFHLISPSYNLFCQGKIFEDTKPHRYWKMIGKKCAQNSYAASALEALEMTVLHWWGIMTNAVHRFIAPSGFVKEKCVEYGVDERKIVVVGHPAPCARSSDGDPSTPLRSAQDDRLCRPRFVFLGRLDPIKGIDVLLRAVATLPHPPTIDIVGSGSAEAQFRALAEGLKLTTITWHGHKTGEELAAILSGASALVLPTLVYETFGLVVLEAAAYGMPTIASRLGGIPEVVEDGILRLPRQGGVAQDDKNVTLSLSKGGAEHKTGILVEPENVEELARALQWAMEHPVELKKMGENARARLTQYSPEEHLKQIEKVYEETIRQVTKIGMRDRELLCLK